MYEMKIRVRYSEVDREGIARLHQILEYFQDCGTFQSEELGLGVEEDQKNHRAWYLIAWNVKIIRHPRMSEYIDVTTQAYKMRGFYGYRRYSIIDEQGATIVSAEAIWILMNTQKMLPMKVTKEIADIYVEKDADKTVRINRKISDDGEWKEYEPIEVTKQYLLCGQKIFSQKVPVRKKFGLITVKPPCLKKQYRYLYSSRKIFSR